LIIGNSNLVTRLPRAALLLRVAAVGEVGAHGTRAHPPALAVREFSRRPRWRARVLRLKSAWPALPLRADHALGLAEG
jgi:hypothetical protein